MNSIIFKVADVESKTDEEVEEIVKSSAYYKTDPMTLKRSKGFVFVNFNFEDLDNEW
jgi:hypothetical protein